MTTNKLMLNRAYQKKDGTYPLVMQLLRHRVKRVIYSKLCLHAEEFDTNAQKVVVCKVKRRTQKEIRDLNQCLAGFRQDIELIINQLDHSGKDYTTHHIVEQYLQLTESGSLYHYWSKCIRELKEADRYGTAAAQQSTLRSVIQFHGSVGINFSKVIPHFVNGYESYLQLKGVSDNTSCFYMRNFKSVFNSAVKEGIIPLPKTDPFAEVQVNPRKTVKRALSRDKLRDLVHLDLANEPELSLSRDLFLFSFYTRGMAFVDIVFLQRSQITENTIHYQRRKTGQFLRIGISELVRPIITKYQGASRFVFPILSSTDTASNFKEYKSALRKINKNLKIIQRRLEINVPLTTYVARHSWATQAKEQGFPLSIISEGLGHTSEKITQIYLKEFDQSILDKANELIIKL